MVRHASAKDEAEEEAVTLTLPREEIRPAWRAVVQAYRHQGEPEAHGPAGLARATHWA
jgi:hypothetical protein